MAGTPEPPPLSASARRSSRSPCICSLAPWQLQQRDSRTGCTSRAKSGGCAGAQGMSMAPASSIRAFWRRMAIILSRMPFPDDNSRDKEIITMLYGQTLARAARFFPRHLAVVDGERRVTYGELAGRVERLARLLVSKGFVPGDRLAFLLPNSLEFVELTFACCRLGVIAVPLNTRYAIPELDEALRDAEPRGFVRHRTLPKPNASADWQVTVGDGELSESAGAAAPKPIYDPAALFGLFYTSGTTGRAKGVMLSHSNLFANMLH